MSSTFPASTGPLDELHTRDMLTHYLGLGYGKLNARMRQGLDLDYEQQQLARHMHSLMQPLASDQVSEQAPLWRGAWMPLASVRAGSWIDPAFVSTSIDRESAESFSHVACVHGELGADPSRHSCLIKIIEAEGAHVNVTAAMESLGARPGADTDEHEIILQPGLEFVVLDCERITDGPWPAHLAPDLVSVAAIMPVS